MRVSKKKTIFNKDYWKVNASHDGYLKRYNSIHERSIEFFPNEMLLVGSDKIIKKNNKNYKFDIRFHVEPNVKIMKTLDNKTILIEENIFEISFENFSRIFFLNSVVTLLKLTNPYPQNVAKLHILFACMEFHQMKKILNYCGYNK